MAERPTGGQQVTQLARPEIRRAFPLGTVCAGHYGVVVDLRRRLDPVRDTTMTYQQYKDWYWGQADKFNPTKFNPDQWATVMKDAGMRYMIFTTKHHDGFCMFDSRYTDFSIAHHAFKDNPQKDVLKYVLEAFRKQNFMIGTYFSKPDWHCNIIGGTCIQRKGAM